jgi:hypothetical protein
VDETAGARHGEAGIGVDPCVAATEDDFKGAGDEEGEDEEDEDEGNVFERWALSVER